jgi:hypothetical protein
MVGRTKASPTPWCGRSHLPHHRGGLPALAHVVSRANGRVARPLAAGSMPTALDDGRSRLSSAAWDLYALRQSTGYPARLLRRIAPLATIC